MLRDNLVGLIESMQISAGVDPLALTIQKQAASDDRPSCLENPRPERAESSLTENATSPFQAEPAHNPALSHMIIPLHEDEWGHTRIPMPSEDMTHAHVVNLIQMPGRDDLLDVNLLDYPWIVHELGHYLLLQHDSMFIPAFQRELDNVVTRLQLGAIADRGAAKVKVQGRLSEVLKVWSPSLSQKNWAHELTIDLMSLWSCGPAYLGSFYDAVEKPERNPYEITETHPPIAVRADALVTAATEMGLADYTGSLRKLSNDWRTGPWKNARDNRFLALARPELINACMKLAVSFSGSLGLRKCTPQRLSKIAEAGDNQPEDEIGLDLLLIAWFVREAKGQGAYLGWESRTLAGLLKRIRQ